MAVGDVEVGIVITFDNKRVITGSAKASKAVRRFTDRAKKNVKDLKKSVGGLGGGFQALNQTLSAANLIYRGVAVVMGKVIGFTKKLIALANTQEAAELRLAAALKTRNDFTEEGFKGIMAFNSALQQRLGIGDEELLQLQGTLVALGVTAKNLREATKATIGLTQISGNLASNARLVGRALTGETSALTRVGIKVDTVTEAKAKMADMFQLAESRAGTFAVQSERLTANLFDMGETIGFLITKNKEAIKTQSNFADAILGLDTKIKKLDNSQDSWLTTLKNTEEEILRLIPVTGFLFNQYDKLVQSGRDATRAQNELAKATNKVNQVAKDGTIILEDVVTTTKDLERVEKELEKAIKKRAKAEADAQKQFLRNINERARAWKSLRAIIADAQTEEQETFVNNLNERAAGFKELRAIVKDDADQRAANAAKFNSDRQKAAEQASARRTKSRESEAQSVAGIAAKFGDAFGPAVAGAKGVGDAFRDAGQTAISIAKQFVLAEAAKGAAAAFAAHQGLPFVGLVIGAAAAAAAFSAISAFVGSFEAGGRVPRTGMALVHEDEVVIPAPVVRDIAAGGGGGGGGMITVVAPMQLLATPNTTQIDRHFQDSVLPAIDRGRNNKRSRSSRRISGRK